MHQHLQNRTTLPFSVTSSRNEKEMLISFDGQITFKNFINCLEKHKTFENMKWFLMYLNLIVCSAFYKRTL